MLCRKFRHTLFVKSTLNNNVQYCLIKPRFFSKRCILDGVFATVSKSEGIRMSSIRFVLKDLSIARLWSAWSRSFIVNNVVRRVKRDRCVREVFDRFRQTIFRPRRTFLLAATAAFKGKGDDSSETPPSCQQNITDDDLEALLTELEGVEKLSQATLFCTSCGKRLVIDKKQPGVRCKESQALEDSSDGWVPYMEAEDVIIWRKEYKPGQGLYAYKVYGRYKEVQAADFAAVQVDGAYRRAWDAAVAALALVERRANGVSDQAVLHWEVLWPRLFANRDYVYIRRHKEFTINSPPLPHKDGIFTPSEPQTPPERPNVHSRAKQKSRDNERREMDEGVKENKVFIIVSRSCEHPKVPETKHAIRVLEYWSHMVVKTIDGPDKPGMEFVLTYYDEPAVGGLPTGVATWATGRAAPAYLERMRRAAAGYQAWSDARGDQVRERDTHRHPAVGGLPTGVATWATGRAAPAYLERMRRAAAGYQAWSDARGDQPAVGGLPTGVATWATGRAAPAYLERMRRAAAGYQAWSDARGDQPAVGGLPTGVATWATGRAAPAYLERMRRAAAGYQAWSDARGDQPAVGGLPTGVATWATGRAAPAYLERMRRAAAGYQAWSDARGDQPAVGGLPTGVATWATGRAAPAYLERMRRAAAGYQAWSDARGDQDLPDFAPFGPPKPQDVCLAPVTVSEQDMESSKDGPDLDSGNGSETTRDQSTQTDDAPDGPTRDVLIKMTAHAKNDVKNQPEVQTKVENMTKKEEQSTPQEGDSDTPEEEESNNNGSWWRYLYPFYYFV
ncbi:uncharacterized protein LOC135085915 [Ostrinia nubilalis]|uniref:uncharacterized protein LOC135085915 n=1 Tax=Ostrinia nubilalis TaxID=29057 RepID=UPI0030824A1C